MEQVRPVLVFAAAQFLWQLLLDLKKATFAILLARW